MPTSQPLCKHAKRWDQSRIDDFVRLYRNLKCRSTLTELKQSSQSTCMGTLDPPLQARVWMYPPQLLWTSHERHEDRRDRPRKPGLQVTTSSSSARGLQHHSICLQPGRPHRWFAQIVRLCPTDLFARSSFSTTRMSSRPPSYKNSTSGELQAKLLASALMRR